MSKFILSHGAGQRPGIELRACVHLAKALPLTFIPRPLIVFGDPASVLSLCWLEFPRCTNWDYASLQCSQHSLTLNKILLLSQDFSNPRGKTLAITGFSSHEVCKRFSTKAEWETLRNESLKYHRHMTIYTLTLPFLKQKHFRQPLFINTISKFIFYTTTQLCK